MHEKNIVHFAAFSFIAGFVLGIFIFASFNGNRAGHSASESAELRNRLEQVNRDFETALASQREASERASGLQAELSWLTDHARSLEMGTAGLAARAGNLADRLDGIAEQSGKLRSGIERAADSLEESRILLGELGTILYGLQTNRGNEDL